MPAQSKNTEKILSQLKGLQKNLQSGEEPLLTVPAIWDSGKQGQGSTPCDVVVTNRRLLGFYLRSFPREKLFLEALDLSTITHVTFREKSNSPVFRELLVTTGTRKIYIRAPRQKIESLEAALREAIGQYTSTSAEASVTTAPETTIAIAPDVETPTAQPAPIYERQNIQTLFETSPLAIMLLFVCGALLETAGIIVWTVAQSSQAALPLCIGGVLIILVSVWLRRQRGKL